MKKRIFCAGIFAAALSLSFLSGCRKVLDYIISKPGGIAKNCDIQMVTSNYVNDCDDGNNFSDTAWFSYNPQGDPVSIIYAVSRFYECFSYPEDKFFKYDYSNKLVLYLNNAFASGKAALYWHKYSYVNSHLITDSTFEYAAGDWFINDQPQYFARVDVTTFELDHFGRVIREVGGVNNINATYIYDSNGNLVKPGVTYTNKTNIRQTNKVWMFLDRDYSINSPVGEASQFNQSGLPVKLNQMPHFIYSYDVGFNNMVVSYTCK